MNINYIEFYIEIGDKIDTLWNMFIAIHIAAFGFIFLSRRHKNFLTILFCLIGYGFFSYINMNALVSSYELLNYIIFDIKIMVESGIFNGDHKSISYLISKDYSNRRLTVLYIHIIAFIFIIYILFSGWRPKFIDRASG
ncbi:hypothetical protein [Stappia sp.]|uniref:hypothetical protein n=1 Tax=Stappia sp. TaxID=1870903 RepID=UPI0032D91C39